MRYQFCHSQAAPRTLNSIRRGAFRKFVEKDKHLCRAFTLVELLVVIGLVALLVSLSFAAYKPVMQRMKATQSLANLRVIGQGTGLYLVDNNGFYPLMCGPSFAAPYWRTTLLPYLPPLENRGWIQVNGSSFSQSPPLIDPFVTNGHHSNLGDYGVNKDVFRYATTALAAAAVKQPGCLVTVMSAEVNDPSNPNASWFIETYQYIAGKSGTLSRPSDRGTGRFFCLFAEGHVEAVDKADLESNSNNYLLANP